MMSSNSENTESCVKDPLEKSSLQQTLQHEDLGYSYLEEIIYTPGLNIIATKIFSLLDYNDLAAFRLTCKGADHLIKARRYWLTTLLKEILHIDKKFWIGVNPIPSKVKAIKPIIEVFPWWQTYFDYITKHASAQMLRTIITVLQKYFHNKRNFSSDCNFEAPLFWSVYIAEDALNLEFLEFFLDSPLRFMEDFVERQEGYHGEKNPFSIACGQGFIKTAQLLLKYAKAQSIQHSASTALHVACFNGQYEAVQFLLKNKEEIGLDVNGYHGAHEFDLATPLHDAVSGFIEDSLGNSFVRYKERKQIVHHLLENKEVYGINANIRNENDLTPMGYAFKEKLPDIVEIFRQHGFELDENTE